MVVGEIVWRVAAVVKWWGFPYNSGKVAMEDVVKMMSWFWCFDVAIYDVIYKCSGGEINLW